MESELNDLRSRRLDAALLCRQVFDKCDREKYIPSMKWLAIGKIEQEPGLTQLELAEHLNIGSNTARLLVQYLFDRGLVEPFACAGDDNVFGLQSTTKCRKLIDGLYGVSAAIRHKPTWEISRETLAVINDGLGAIQRDLEHSGLVFGAPS